MKISSIIGTRPNFIKLAPLIDELKYNDNIDHKIIHTGQHYDLNMSDVFFNQLNIPRPDYNLKVGSSTLTSQTADIMKGLEDILSEDMPDLIFLIGDVNSTLAAAVTAAQMNIKTAHIESGLRSYNKTMPEEINRIVTDHLSDILYAPTETAMKNLANEGLTEKSIFSGDIMYDAILRNLPIAEKNSNIIEKLGIMPKDYYLVTLHRPYNVDNKDILNNIFYALKEINKPFVFPVHPRTMKNIKKFGLDIPKNLILTEPIGYLDMLMLEKNAKKIITDSGGIQKEAYFQKIPCITLRPETEWVETLISNCNILVKNRDRIDILEALNYDQTNCHYGDYFGDGKASETIIKKIS